MMEEAVMKKCLHEENCSITTLSSKINFPTSIQLYFFLSIIQVLLKPVFYMALKDVLLEYLKQVQQWHFYKKLLNLVHPQLKL